MTRSLAAAAVAALLVAAAGTSAPVPKVKAVHPLFENVDAKSQPPQELIDAYAAFVEQAQKDGDVEKFCLPLAIRIVDARPKNVAVGEDISKAFLMKGFDPEVWTARKVSDECYLIRTTTTSVSFIQTKSGEWKVYKYVDRMMGC